MGRSRATTTAARSTGATAPRRRQPLTRERIVAAAVALADEKGIEAVGMRAVARRLGVDPMSLYNHVDGKAALFDGIAELLMEYADLPGPAPWDQWARAAASCFMDVALAHPGAFGVFGAHPVTTIKAAAHVEPFLDGLIRAGFPVESCALILNAFFSFVASYGLLRTSTPLTAPPGTDHTAEAIPDELRPTLPALSAVSDANIPIDPESTFDLGVELLIDGLRARLRRLVRPGRGVVPSSRIGGGEA